jgi:hypothetical protein
MELWHVRVVQKKDNNNRGKKEVEKAKKKR